VGLVRFRSATEKENNFLVGLTPFRKSMCDLGKFQIPPSTTIHHHPSPSITIHHHPSPSITIHHHPSPSLFLRKKSSSVGNIYIDRSPSASFGMWRTQPLFQVEIAERNDGG